MAALASVERSASTLFARRMMSPPAEAASSCFRVSSLILTETRWSVATVNCRTFSLTSRSNVCALMVTLKEVWPAAEVMGTVTAIPFSVVPFFFASCLALSMADWTELLSTAALPFLSGCMGLVSPVQGLEAFPSAGWCYHCCRNRRRMSLHRRPNHQRRNRCRWKIAWKRSTFQKHR